MSILRRLTLGVGCICGCATPQFDTKVHFFGEMDPIREARVVEAAEELSWERDYPVKVIAGTLPPGISLSENSKQITVAPEVAGVYQILGTVASEHAYTNMGAGMGSIYWFVSMHEQHSTVRDIYCKVQMPLRLLSVGVWLLVPFNYPCFVGYDYGEAENDAIHIQELKRTAFAMGANLLIVTERANLRETTVYTYGGMSVGAATNVYQGVGMTAFALKVDEEALSRLLQQHAPVPVGPMDNKVEL